MATHQLNIYWKLWTKYLFIHRYLQFYCKFFWCTIVLSSFVHLFLHSLSFSHLLINFFICESYFENKFANMVNHILKTICENFHHNMKWIYDIFVLLIYKICIFGKNINAESLFSRMHFNCLNYHKARIYKSKVNRPINCYGQTLIDFIA